MHVDSLEYGHPYMIHVTRTDPGPLFKWYSENCLLTAKLFMQKDLATRQLTVIAAEKANFY